MADATLLVCSASSAAAIEAEVREAFALVDVDRDGLLQEADVRCAIIYLLGYAPSKLEVASMMAREAHGAGGRRDGGLTMDRFVHAMTRRIQQQDVSAYLQQLFAAFDTKERGFIVWEDFLAIATPLAPAVSPSLLRRVFAAADRDGNGKVSYREFDHCMTHAHTPAQHAHAHAHARNTATSGHRGSSAMTPLH